MSGKHRNIDRMKRLQVKQQNPTKGNDNICKQAAVNHAINSALCKAVAKLKLFRMRNVCSEGRKSTDSISIEKSLQPGRLSVVGKSPGLVFPALFHGLAHSFDIFAAVILIQVGRLDVGGRRSIGIIE